MINIKSIVESKINALWEKYADEEFCAFPANLIHEIPEKGIIFIGINPSLMEK